MLRLNPKFAKKLLAAGASPQTQRGFYDARPDSLVGSSFWNVKGKGCQFV